MARIFLLPLLTVDPNLKKYITYTCSVTFCSSSPGVLLPYVRGKPLAWRPPRVHRQPRRLLRRPLRRRHQRHDGPGTRRPVALLRAHNHKLNELPRVAGGVEFCNRAILI